MQTEFQSLFDSNSAETLSHLSQQMHIHNFGYLLHKFEFDLFASCGILMSIYLLPPYK